MIAKVVAVAHEQRAAAAPAKQKKKNEQSAVQRAAPAAEGFTSRTPERKISHGPNGSVVIETLEYIGSVYNGIAAAEIEPDTQELQAVCPALAIPNPNGGSSTASAKNLVSASNSLMFPAVAAFSSQYEMYRINKLEFYYRPMCATSVGGSIKMAFDSDPGDQIVSDPRSLMDFRGSVSTVSYAAASLRVPLELLKKRGDLFVDQTNDGQSGDVALSRQGSVGRFYIYGQGCPIGSLGELWIRSSITLLTRQNDARKIVSSGSFRKGDLIVSVPDASAAAPWGGSALANTANKLMRFVNYRDATGVVRDAIELLVNGEYKGKLQASGTGFNTPALHLSDPQGSFAVGVEANTSTNTDFDINLVVKAAPAVLYLTYAGLTTVTTIAMSLARLWPGTLTGAGEQIEYGPSVIGPRHCQSNQFEMEDQDECRCHPRKPRAVAAVVTTMAKNP